MSYILGQIFLFSVLSSLQVQKFQVFLKVDIACSALFLKRKKSSYRFKSCVTRVDLLIKILIIIEIRIIKFSFFVKRGQKCSLSCNDY